MKRIHDACCVVHWCIWIEARGAKGYAGEEARVYGDLGYCTIIYWIALNFRYVPGKGKKGKRREHIPLAEGCLAPTVQEYRQQQVLQVPPGGTVHF